MWLKLRVKDKFYSLSDISLIYLFRTHIELRMFICVI